MMSERVLIVVLTGLPAAGKSTLARALSSELQNFRGGHSRAPSINAADHIRHRFEHDVAVTCLLRWTTRNLDVTAAGGTNSWCVTIIEFDPILMESLRLSGSHISQAWQVCLGVPCLQSQSHTSKSPRTCGRAFLLSQQNFMAVLGSTEAVL